jgi:hypothetical protein
MKIPRVSALAVILLFAAAACARHESTGGGGGHTHQAPHGGTLIEVGEHAYNVELVRDPEAGKLTAYVLDAHAENFIRINVPAIELVAFTGGERRSLTLRAVANSATGETVGDTSQFDAQADWLKNTGEFPGEFPLLDIRGTKFQNVALYLGRRVGR